MRMIIGSEGLIYDPTRDIVNFCKNELVVKNPEYDRKRRMGLWLGKTPEYLDLYRSDGNALIVPYGAAQYLRSHLVRTDGLSLDFASNQPIEYNATVPLYDYQKKAVDEMLKAGYGILQSPAGSGKTQMGIAMITESGCRALWLTHTKDLLKQSYDRALQYIDKSCLGTITDGKVHIGSGITFATVQTMANMDLRPYRYAWDLVVVDECHRVSATATSRSQFGRVLNTLAARQKYGLSATVHRADGMIRASFALLGNIKYTVPDEAVAGKVERVRIVRRDTEIPLHSSCQDTDGTLLYATLLKYLTESSRRNRIIADDLMQNCEHYNLILSDRIKHLEILKSLLPYGLQNQAVLITGNSNTKERAQAIEDVRAGRKRYLFSTYRLAKEGLDIPRLDRLYLATPQKDYAIIVQAIGRIARHFDGKGEPVAYDYVDAIRYCERQYKKRCASYHKIHCKM